MTVCAYCSVIKLARLGMGPKNKKKSRFRRGRTARRTGKKSKLTPHIDS